MLIPERQGDAQRERRNDRYRRHEPRADHRAGKRHEHGQDENNKVAGNPPFVRFRNIPASERVERPQLGVLFLLPRLDGVELRRARTGIDDRGRLLRQVVDPPRDLFERLGECCERVINRSDSASVDDQKYRRGIETGRFRQAIEREVPLGLLCGRRPAIEFLEVALEALATRATPFESAIRRDGDLLAELLVDLTKHGAHQSKPTVTR